MNQVILPLLVSLPLVVFWLWMFSDMTKNDRLPPCFITITNGNDSRLDWAFVFFLMNVFGTLLYYMARNRNRD